MLKHRSYLINERVGSLAFAGTYDIVEHIGGRQVGIAREKPGAIAIILRALIKDKRALPTKVFVYEGCDHKDDSKLLFSIEKGFQFLRAKMDVRDAEGRIRGRLRSKLIGAGGGFAVFDATGKAIADLKGDWRAKSYKLTDDKGKELGIISKQWNGLAKELLTSADKYSIELSEEPSDEATAMLLLAAGLAVDIVYKE